MLFDEATTIRAIVDAFRPPDSPVSVEAATRRALQFLAAFRAGGSQRAKMLDQVVGALGLVLGGSTDSRAETRRKLDALEHGLPQLRDLARLAQRLATIILYATLDDSGRPPAAVALGYEIFQDRPRASTPDLAEPILSGDILVGPDEPVPDDMYDVVIVGSGAAGSVLARRCVERGLNVAVIEAGDYVPEKFSRGGGRPCPRMSWTTSFAITRTPVCRSPRATTGCSSSRGSVLAGRAWSTTPCASGCPITCARPGPNDSGRPGRRMAPSMAPTTASRRTLGSVR